MDTIVVSIALGGHLHDVYFKSGQPLWGKPLRKISIGATDNLLTQGQTESSLHLDVYKTRNMYVYRNDNAKGWKIIHWS